MPEIDAEKLARERRKGEEWGAYKTKLDEMDGDVKRLITAQDNLRETLDKVYAIKLVEKIVFGLVGLLCMAVAGALIKLVVLK